MWHLFDIQQAVVIRYALVYIQFSTRTVHHCWQKCLETVSTSSDHTPFTCIIVYLSAWVKIMHKARDYGISTCQLQTN